MMRAIDITTLAQVTPRRPIPAQGAYGLGAAWVSVDVAQTPFLCCCALCSKNELLSATLDMEAIPIVVRLLDIPTVGQLHPRFAVSRPAVGAEAPHDQHQNVSESCA
jgi:hypothetical protein